MGDLLRRSASGGRGGLCDIETCIIRFTADVRHEIRMVGEHPHFTVKRTRFLVGVERPSLKVRLRE